MIYIIKNNVNTIALDIKGLVPTSYSLYNFIEFIPEFNIDEDPARYFIFDDLSTSCRYAKLSLTESPTGSTATVVSQAPIKLSTGQYRYMIYTSSSVIDPNDLDMSMPLQEGRMIVVDLQTQLENQ